MVGFIILLLDPTPTPALLATSIRKAIIIWNVSVVCQSWTKLKFKIQRNIIVLYIFVDNLRDSGTADLMKIAQPRAYSNAFVLVRLLSNINEILDWSLLETCQMTCPRLTCTICTHCIFLHKAVHVDHLGHRFFTRCAAVNLRGLLAGFRSRKDILTNSRNMLMDRRA